MNNIELPFSVSFFFDSLGIFFIFSAARTYVSARKAILDIQIERKNHGL